MRLQHAQHFGPWEPPIPDTFHRGSSQSPQLETVGGCAQNLSSRPWAASLHVLISCRRDVSDLYWYLLGEAWKYKWLWEQDLRSLSRQLLGETLMANHTFSSFILNPRTGPKVWKHLGLSLGSVPFLAGCMSFLETDNLLLMCPFTHVYEGSIGLCTKHWAPWKK